MVVVEVPPAMAFKTEVDNVDRNAVMTFLAPSPVHLAILDGKQSLQLRADAVGSSTSPKTLRFHLINTIFPETLRWIHFSFVPDLTGHREEKPVQHTYFIWVDFRFFSARNEPTPNIN